MTLDKDDKDYISAELQKLINGKQPSEGSHDNEYLLHLYDQLWDNMRAKENRLWSFLALYGAAVGLVFAGGQTSQTAGADIFALIIVLALSTWAVLIILNANWWVRRNLLMVGGIEDRFKRIKPGIYPKQFPDSKGGFDVLYRGSILVLTMLLMILYARTAWSYRNGSAVSSFHILVGMTLLYLLFIGAALYCLRQHERYIRLVQETRRSITERAGNLTRGKKCEMLQNEVEERRKQSARLPLFILLIIVAGLFDFVLYTNGLMLVRGLGLWIVISLQVFLFWLYGVLWLRYRRPFSNQCVHNTAQNLITDELQSVKALIESGTLISVANIQQLLEERVKCLKDLSDLFEKLCDERSEAIKTSIGTFQSDLDSLTTEVNAGKDSRLNNATVVLELNKVIVDLTGIVVNKLSWLNRSGKDCGEQKVEDRIKVMDQALVGFERRRWLWALALITLASAIFPAAYLSSATTTVRSDITRNRNSPSTADIRAQADEAEALLKKLRETQSRLEIIETQQTQQLTIKREIGEAMKNFVTKQDLQQQLDKDRTPK